MRQNQNQAFYMKRQFIWDVAFFSQKAQTKQFSSCVEGVGRGVRGWVGSHCKEQITPIKCKKAYPTICTFLLKLQLFNWAASTSQKIPEIMSVSSSPFFVCLFPQTWSCCCCSESKLIFHTRPWWCHLVSTQSEQFSLLRAPCIHNKDCFLAVTHA